jgi:hypothetical protein
VGHPSGSVFAWFILRSVSLGFSQVLGFFPLGFGGPVGVLGLVSVLLGALFVFAGFFWGFLFFLWRFLICLLGVFLWVSCRFSWVFMWVS